MPFALAVHGGAGVVTAAVQRHGESAYMAALSDSLDAGRRILACGGSATDAVEAAVRVLEDCELFNAGRGSVFCDDGTHRMEASLQEGHTRQAGAVIGLQTTRHPISGARAVMERTRHVALADCDAWLAEQGLEQRPSSWFDTDERYRQLEAARIADVVRLDHEGSDTSSSTGKDASRTGTVGAVAVDVHGHLAAATSTGGMTNKMVGRVGDTPVIGAGTHACARCAVSGTGRGEQFLRHEVAGAIGTRVATGASLQAACAELVHHTLDAGDGGVIAVNSAGEIAMPFNTPGMFRGWVREVEGEAHTVSHTAVWRDVPSAPQPLAAAHPASASVAITPSPPSPPSPPMPVCGASGDTLLRCNQQSAISNQQTAISNQQSAITCTARDTWLRGKTILVTGGAFGIGRAIVLRAARLGAALIVADLPGEARGAEATVAEARRAGARTAVFVGADVSDGAHVEAMITRGVAACGGRLDAVYANAGIGSAKCWAHEMADATFAKTVAVNLLGAFHTAK